MLTFLQVCRQMVMEVAKLVSEVMAAERQQKRTAWTAVSASSYTQLVASGITISLAALATGQLGGSRESTSSQATAVHLKEVQPETQQLSELLSPYCL